MDTFDIRYLRLKATVRMIEDCTLPKAKASMIRGGIGDMLLKKYCNFDGDCEDCKLCKECPVQNIMYSTFDKLPSFMGKNASLGYIVECGDYRDKFDSGDEFIFFITLFGKAISYIDSIVVALYDLAGVGLTKQASKFDIMSIVGRHGYDIRGADGNLNAMACEPDGVDRYVRRRYKELTRNGCITDLKMVFQNETTLSDRKRMLTEFEVEPFLRALILRINIMRQYDYESSEGIELWHMPEPLPKMVSQKARPMAVPRYSDRKSQKMYLKGIKGSMTLSNVSEEWIKLLLAGEVLHVGKNTSFGFGKYLVITEEDE
jgi:hypothetical protein